MPRSPHKFHYVYKTTCKITNKFYIGIHSTSDLEDGYMGSGVRISRSLKKYGKQNHVCEILEYLDNRKNLMEREKSLITEEILKDPYCMNIIKGGVSLGLNYSKEHTLETKQQISLKMKGKSYEEIHGDEKAEGERKKRSEGVKRAHSKLNEEERIERYSKSILHLKTPTEETRKKMSESQTGKKKSMETRNKISKGNKNKFVSDETRFKMSLSQRNMSEETKNKMSMSAKERPKIKCLYCDIVAQYSHISRWHNEKCKNKP